MAFLNEHSIQCDSFVEENWMKQKYGDSYVWKFLCILKDKLLLKDGWITEYDVSFLEIIMYNKQIRNTSLQNVVLNST